MSIFHTIDDLLTVFALISGLFFMLVAALGLVRMPDFYHRTHAATKGATLGTVSLLLAATLFLSSHEHVGAINIITKAMLVIMFTFIANPVGAHLLSKAAHLDGSAKWQRTLGDELEADEGK